MGKYFLGPGNDSHPAEFWSPGHTYVTLKDVPFPRAGTDFTIAAWVAPDLVDSAYHAILGYQPSLDNGSGPRSPCMYVAPGGGLHFDSYDASGKTRFFANHIGTGDFFKPGQYVHVAWVKKGTTYTVYRNGTQYPDKKTTWKAPASVTLSNKFWIGRVDNFFTGRVDEISFFATALSAKEIAGISSTAVGVCDEQTIAITNPYFEGLTARLAFSAC